MRQPFCNRLAWAGLALALAAGGAAAQQISPEMIAGLQWRSIGPFRGGRVASVTGVVGQPGVFYMGLPNGGVWKTTSGGETWYPVSDADTGFDCVGAIQVAPSDPNVIYAGTGDLVTGGGINVGDGVYKSTDAGLTWKHVGLENTYHINSILVDPRDPNLVLVSAQGEANRPDADRGVFRSTDGGAHWTRALHIDDQTAPRDMAWAYDKPSVVFATTISDGGGGAGGGGGAAGGANNRTRLFKSTDEGVSWSEIKGDGVPPMSGRMGVAVAMHTDGQRIYLIGAGVQGGSGLFRSDDQGATWKQMAVADSRITNGQGTYSCGVWVDSQNPDILYTASTSTYRSTDGGKTFISWKGAPGGDDYHEMWIDPNDGKRILLGTDQGATVTYDAGLTWSSWYNQATDQVYHISTDNRWPYWVLGAQQDSGSTMIRSRGDFGEIVAQLDWYPVAAYEFGSLASDPKDPNIIYAQGPGAASVIKIVQPTGEWENVGPNFGAANHYRATSNPMRKFDPLNPNAFYMAYQCLVVTRDGGMTWKDATPDLTTPKGEPQVPCDNPAPAATPAAAGARGRGPAAPAATPPAPAAPAPAPAVPGTPPATPPAAAGRGGAAGGSIVDFSLSTFKEGVAWTGSSNGQIFNTLDGVHWNNVTNYSGLPAPPAGGGGRGGGNGIASIEAGHFDANTAYFAIDRHGSGDWKPYIWKTHDGGKTWTMIVNGLPTDERTGDFVRVVKEDPKQPGLLFCGTETTVYASFDDGDHWQSLRLNLPTTSIRDMVFHTDDHMSDLVIGTYGRSFWVLDDMSPLREIAAHNADIAAAPAYLFKVNDAIRVHRNVNGDTPFPPEVPHADNPPLGAIIYYHLSRRPQGEVKIQIFDSANHLVRTLSSIPAPWTEAPAPVPDYWLRKPKGIPTAIGTNRTNWDLLYDTPPAFNHDIESMMGANPFDTPYGPEGPLAAPGRYTVKLTVDGQVYSQPLVVHNDPRIGESPAKLAALAAQTRLVLAAYQGMKDTFAGNTEVVALRAQLKDLTGATLPPDVSAAATALDARLGTLGMVPAAGRRGGGGGGGRGRGGVPPPGTVIPFTTLNATFSQILDNVGGLEMAPNQPQKQTWLEDCREFNTAVAAWKTMLVQDVVNFNQAAQEAGLKPLAPSPTALSPVDCQAVVSAPAAAASAVAPAKPAAGGGRN